MQMKEKQQKVCDSGDGDDDEQEDTSRKVIEVEKTKVDNSRQEVLERRKKKLQELLQKENIALPGGDAVTGSTDDVKVKDEANMIVDEKEIADIDEVAAVVTEAVAGDDDEEDIDPALKRKRNIKKMLVC